MRFSYFKTLSIPWQARVICECGVRLGERRTTEMFIELYQIDSFYAEVHYRQSDSEVMKITSFDDVCYLEPYFGSISLPDLSTKSVKNDK
jgi:hypothetical protein